MPRKSRIIYPGAIYHIYQRGNNKDFIFEDSNVKRFMLKYLEEYNKRFDYEILAYVIMNNHYHLLMKTNSSTISEIMFFFNNLMGKFINGRLNRTGHAFEDRYKCELVETDAYLIWLLRYIHRNPVKAGLCIDVKDYKWSSHHIYEGRIESYVNTEFIMNLLGENESASLKQYSKLINCVGNEKDKGQDYQVIREALNMPENILPHRKIYVSNENKVTRKAFEYIIHELNIKEDVFNAIKTGKRHQYLRDIKLKFIRAAMKECYSIREIAAYMNLHPSAVSKSLSRYKIK
ncbi:transposase [Clostridium polynesiense]|uniref:transposase n=1 Tax=Clostridium polynesiense TaxID=1325933 RepID=UPI0006938C5C|nr:transposase [Clostridium polynesiense]